MTDTGKRTWEEPAIVFTDPASGSVWAGREWPYYVKTNNRILGLWPDDAGMLQWYGSSITKLDRDEDVVKRFEEATNSTSDLADPPFVGETNLRDLLNINFFNATPGSMNSAAGNINQIGFDRGLLKLDLDSPTRAFHAQIWIDVDTREVVRAIEDGKVVFPKQ